MSAIDPVVHRKSLLGAALSLPMLSAVLCVAVAAADAPAKKGTDQVVVATADGRGPTTKWTGEILEYTGKDLQLRLPDEHEKAFPTARIVSVATHRSAQQQAGDTAFGAGNFRQALGHYRAALDGQHETREWVRRQILAQIVWCYQALGEWESACDYFLMLYSLDRTTQYFDCLPLAWLPAEPSGGLAQKARKWLTETEAPIATLLGASHLLSTADRPAALAALAKLSADRDQRVALSAQAQQWRTVAFQATDTQSAAWQQTIAKMPEGLRAGPDFILGSALAPRHPEAAVLWLLRPAVAYPRERQLAAEGLASAATALDKLDRREEAQVLWAEIAKTYPDQTLPTKLAAEHLTGAAPRVANAGVVESREPADERFLAGLRRRGLFGLAETDCRHRLADPELDEVARAEVVIDLVRTLAEHALAVPGDSREPIWQEISTVTADFQRGHPQNPRVLLVRMQAALAMLARAELARQETEIGEGTTQSIDSVRAAIRAAIVNLKQFDDDLASEIRRRTRPVVAAAGNLSDAELSSLEANARYQLARGFRNQALSYPVDSNDRLNALTQAIELLGPLGKAADDDPLAWPSRVEEIVCLRQVGKLAEATHRLSEFQSSSPPIGYLRRLRAEGIRLLLAKGRLDEALTAAGPPVEDDEIGAADLDFARLETLLALWQRAADRGTGDLSPDADAPAPKGQTPAELPAADWQRQATAQVQHIEKVHGPYWMRRAETLLAEVLAAGGSHRPSGTPGSLDSLIRAAASYWRAGQAGEAVATYDQAARAATDAGQVDKAFELGMTAASIQHQRKQFRDAQHRFQQLATAMPNHPRAAEAHLAAIYDQAAGAAAAGKSQDPATLAEYRQLLEYQLLSWPKALSAGQAAWWLGRLCEHDGQWREAILAFRQVPPEHAQYAAAVEATAKAYQRVLDQSRAMGKPDEQTARQALDWLRQVIVESEGQPGDRAELGRQATLWAARISLSDIPGGAADAEGLLRQALSDKVNTPADWEAAARLLLVSALAERQRYDEAATLLGKIGAGSPGELLALLERLIQASSQAKAQQRPTLVRLEQQTLAALDAQKPHFDEAGKRRLEIARLRTLIDSGSGKAALPLAESLSAKYPDEGSIQEDYAHLLGQSSDPAQVRVALTRWREIVGRSRAGTPRWFRAQLGMAQAQLALGNRPQARTIVKVVEASYPTFAPSGGEAGAELRAAFLDVLARSEKPK
jgi:hypothetical protein